MEVKVRDARGATLVARFRPATPDDVPAIERLVALATRGLSRGDYTSAQIEAALGSALGVDSQLIRDRTYFVAEAGGALVACGGWSNRRTLFGGDSKPGREPELLDPARDAARIRAFFVHPDWARQGLGRAMLELCEAEALENGFTTTELMATLPGERLYVACGYEPRPAIEHTLPGGLGIRFVPMHKILRSGTAATAGTEAADNRSENGMDMNVIIRRFESPDEVREMILGRFEVIRIGGLTVGRATYQPGWKWSTHVGPTVGATRCTIEHLGLVISGVATAAFDDGRVIELKPGDLFYIPAEPHDSWVVGDQPYVSLHFVGADRYAAKPS